MSRLLFVIVAMLAVAAVRADDTALAAYRAGEHPYRLEPDEHGRWAFVAPDGTRFFSIGVNGVRDDGRSVALLRDHGFNTAGAWSDDTLNASGLYEIPVIYISEWRDNRGLNGLRPDIREEMERRFAEVLARFPDPERVIGFFLDNEIKWGGGGEWGTGGHRGLLEDAVGYPAGSPEREAAIAYLDEHAGGLYGVNRIWDTNLTSWAELTRRDLTSGYNRETQEIRRGFTALAAEKWYEAAASVVREMAPGKLILGTRHAGSAPIPVLEAEARHCDALSFNRYPADGTGVPEHTVALFHAVSGKPVMITEFSWAAMENNSGNPNTRGTGSPVETQADRARNYRLFMDEAYRLRPFVGSHWFIYTDQPPEGRSRDGENMNYGIVDIHGGVYTELLSAMRDANARVHELGPEDLRSLPQVELPLPRHIVYTPPAISHQPLSLLRGEQAAPPDVFVWGDTRGVAADHPDGSLVYTITRYEGGTGLRFIGPPQRRGERNGKPFTDLSGFREVVLDATIPREVNFAIEFHEAGYDRAWLDEYDLRAGDDGESFTTHRRWGRGARHHYRFPLQDLISRTQYNNYWGNQNGERLLEIDTLDSVTLSLGGENPYEVVLLIHDLRLE